MTIEELKAAFHSGAPVQLTYHGHVIKNYRVSALIWRKKNGGNAVEAELMDKTRRGVVIALPEQIELMR